MNTRFYNDGGGVDITPEVKIKRFVLSPTEASFAARTARHFLEVPDKYSYVHTVDDRVDVVKIGWWDPENEADTGTIWSRYRFQLRHATFVEAAHRLIAFSGGEPPNFVGVYSHNQGVLPLHQDTGDFKRSLLVLDGAKKVTVTHSNDLEVFASIPVWCGDAYSMQFREDELTVQHEIDNLNPENIALYISN